MSRRFWSALLIIVVSLPLCGCVTGAVHTEHEYLLARTEGNDLVALADDNPLYERFSAEVLSDAYLAMLLSVFEHTTESFLATETHTPFPVTLASRPVIVVDSVQAGVLHDVKVHQNGRTVTVELALGLGRDGAVALQFAGQELPRAVADLLMELMGLPLPRGLISAGPWVYEVTTPDLAFWVGFGAALDALQARERPEVALALQQKDNLTPEERDLLARYELVPENGLRYRYRGDVPTPELRTREEAERTPGVVATFLYRLLQTADHYYPQRFLLWFNAYDGEEISYGKVLLAVGRMAGSRAMSLTAFVEAYTQLFPAEGDTVAALVEDVLGP